VPDRSRGAAEVGRSGSPGGLFAVRFYVLGTCLAIGLAVAIVGGGDARFSAPSFDGPRGLVSWTGFDPHLVWGAAFLAYGIVLVGGLGRTWAIHALRFGLVLYWFLAISFTGSLFTQPTASATGLVAYACIGVAHALLADHFHAYGWDD